MIKARCERGELVKNWDPECLNPASLDVRLGPSIMLECEEQGLIRADISEHSKENPYLLAPGEFILGETMEVFNVPDQIAGIYKLKSSMARRGLNHLYAGYIDPGFNGSVLTVELHNVLRFGHQKIWPGMRCGQIVWHWMSQAPQQSYSKVGHYNNHATVMPCVVDPV